MLNLKNYTLYIGVFLKYLNSAKFYRTIDL